jgi:dTMP kinase
MFITLEGPEGSGKSSQMKSLADFIQQQGCDVLTSREPGGTPIGDQVRAVLMGMENDEMHPRTETLLFCAARAQHVEQLIRPHLERGGVVLCDRYADSTLAYQGYGHGYDRDFLRMLLDYSTGKLWPDLSILMDLPAEQGLQRRLSSGGEWNRMDDYELAFHRRVREGYHDLVQREPERWEVVDANRSVEEVQRSLRQVVRERLQGRNSVSAD